MTITLTQRFEYLTEDQVSKFHRDGYLCLPKFLSEEQTNCLLNRAKKLLNEFDLSSHPKTRFTTGKSGKHVGDEYFLNSGDKIRFFLEEGAVDTDGKLNRPKEEAVNKIGHALHELDPVFRAVTLENTKLQSLVRDLRFHENPRGIQVCSFDLKLLPIDRYNLNTVLQSMVICKQREVGGEVPEHNDSTFLYTDPPTALGFWFALEKCTPHNGALSFLPGSHMTAPIASRFVRALGGGTTFEIVPGQEGKSNPKGEYVLEVCEPGDLVLIHGSVLHKSEKNTSQTTRFAYTFHMIEGPEKAKYDEKNWLQPTANMPFSQLFPKT